MPDVCHKAITDTSARVERIERVVDEILRLQQASHQILEGKSLIKLQGRLQ